MLFDTDEVEGSNSSSLSFYTPVNEKSKQNLWDHFISFSRENDQTAELRENVSIAVMMNRHLMIPFSRGQSCYLSFHDLCEKERRHWLKWECIITCRD